MKILTLNTHSLQEENYPQKLEWFVEGILKEKPDIIALQEVNQTCNAEILEPEMLEGQYPVPGCMQIRGDNHAAQVARRLRQAGVDCYWAWIPIKLGYGKYDEGVAVLSLGRPIRCVDQFPISRIVDYENWRTRAVLGVQVEGLEDWFYTVHMGWWDDKDDPFSVQWERFKKQLSTKNHSYNTWLLGDFNSPAEVKSEGYDLVKASGFYDTYTLADTKDDGITVEGVIDGWRDKILDPNTIKGMRIDHIFTNQKLPVRSSLVIFNGQETPVISDHFGVMIETN